MNYIRDEWVHTRKEHVCWGCGREFAKGTRMKANTTADGGEISTTHWCETCTEYWNKYMGYEDEIGCGELRDDDGDWEKLRLKIEEVESDE